MAIRCKPSVRVELARKEPVVCVRPIGKPHVFFPSTQISKRSRGAAERAPAVMSNVGSTTASSVGAHTIRPIVLGAPQALVSLDTAILADARDVAPWLSTAITVTL